MAVFVTGATGFIGRHLVGHLLDRHDRVYVLCRAASLWKLEQADERVVPIVGDLAEQALGVDLTTFDEPITDVFHLAAIYDLTAPDAEQRVANVEGTRHAMELAGAVGARCFHHVSSIAAGGLYAGTFREDMFDEHGDLDSNPYFRTKHDGEALVRRECPVPWRIYRPGIVVGHSVTGEIDKVDGPYYVFKLLQRAGDALPSWLQLIGPDAGSLNLVPVDYVAAAIDHIASLDGLDGRAFHLTDTQQYSLGELVNLFGKAAGVPRLAIRLDAPGASLAPRALRALRAVPPIKAAADAALGTVGIPTEMLAYVGYSTTFDNRNTRAALAGTDIEVPPLRSYASTLYAYWQRHLDPDRGPSKAMLDALSGKLVMITGASSGIGRELAMQVAAAGGQVLLVARTASKLEETWAEIEAAGGTAYVHACDLSDMDDIDRMADKALADHGRVDVLVNNAGRSIRRSVALSYDRFHDYERTMQLNYFGAVRLILKLLPVMRQPGYGGHIINISSVGTQVHPPRFGAYVASKAALDAFSRCIASEIIDEGVHITTVNMPLVRTPMIAPTKMYSAFPTIAPAEAADMITAAMVGRPKRVATTLGTAGQIAYALSPKLVDQVLNRAYHLFPDSSAAREGGSAPDARDDTVSTEAVAFANLLRGVHW